MTKLKVVLCWHMHQPAYRDLYTGQYQLPWTYLHAIKDYVDMIAHLEAVPAAKAVINFAPTLLEQIDDYAQQIQVFLRDKTPIQDPLLAALISQPPYHPFVNNLLMLTPDEAHDERDKMLKARLELIAQCLRANRETLIARFQPYQHLAEIADGLQQKPEVVLYLDDQYFVDLVMWYHLAWLGETVRRQDKRIQALIEKGHYFSQEDRQTLLVVIGELLSTVIERYKVLAHQGQIELSLTPYAHPIMPLLIDVHAAQQAVPEVTLPELKHYQDGAERVRWHMIEGIEIFKKYFGYTPQGCWPSEGGISEATIRLLEPLGVRWMASGENVLRNSLNQAGRGSESIHRPYRLSDTQVTCFFRDDGLSDAIGFEYAKWHADDAVNNLLHHLENINRGRPDNQACVVSIILDGENAWEYYPENGYYFLNALYRKLAEHPQLTLTTFSECLETEVTELPNLVAGSWVYGNFATWIGDKDKNRGWQMLDEAKSHFDAVIERLKPKQRAAAERQLATCEGSDWCWWFGDYNPAVSVRDFDRLYRLHLTSLYRLLGEPSPEYLTHAFTHGGGEAAAGGVMRKGRG
ncbi:MAG: glycoside hydrolase family 57 protein [Pseudomonadota bacterium]|nr:glycoside hydrolase family 57 protein [Pseudomonadota bacterium]